MGEGRGSKRATTGAESDVDGVATRSYEALELLLRGLEEAAARVDGHALERALDRDDDHVFDGALTLLLRLLFILFAEGRGLLPVDDERYAARLGLGAALAQLEARARVDPESLAERFGAWRRVVTLCRALHSGLREPLSLPARGGALFDPQRYPFVDGESTRISDAVLLGALRRLTRAGCARVDFGALEVEQLGAVFESLMGYRVERLRGRGVCVGAARVWICAADVLARPATQRVAWLKSLGLRPARARRVARVVEESGGDEDAVLEQLERWRARGARRRAPGSLVLQPGPDRRRTSTHYTPRALADAIARRALTPLLPADPASGGGDALLRVRVCDPAMGSGAFLLAACRFLGDELARAWRQAGRAGDDDELGRRARLAVARRCLYGLDKHPIAAQLASLSLWLETRAAEQPFTFLEGQLRCGDALLGLRPGELAGFGWGAHARPSPALQRAAAEGVEASRRRGDAGGVTDGALARARLLGDLVLAAFFAGRTETERARALADTRREVEAWLETGGAPPTGLRARQDELRARQRPFHWALEFPELFVDGDGVDAILANPPYAGKNTMSASLGRRYLDWLARSTADAHGNADLCAYFLRRASELIGASGTIGLIATETIAQGDTRETGLQPLLRDGAAVYAASRGLRWSGDASVIVAGVHLAKGGARARVGPATLDGVEVAAINSRLRAGPERPDPAPLPENKRKCFQGVVVLGMGFALTLAERDALVRARASNAARILPYLGGDEVSACPEQRARRFVICLEGLELAEAEARHPELVEILRARVKPARDRLADNPDGRRRRRRWWQYGRYTPALYDALASVPRCLVTTRVKKHVALCFQPTAQLFANTLYVFPLARYSEFALLQARVHDIWTRRLSSTLGAGLNYSSTDCFETFPFPDDARLSAAGALAALGERLYRARAELMRARKHGLTVTYNQLLDPAARDPALDELRALHVELDRRALAAYGWGDLDVPPYTTPSSAAARRRRAAFDDELVDRLFALNAARAAARR
ncbi:MAG: hypothetical protein H6713_24235 [Myxococcales bacterium]|nr:hypothetical protein [Myxococcales bacterium]